MADQVLEHIYRLKGGNQEAVERENPLLDRREPIVVYCRDGKTRIKIGDGVHRYNELDWSSDNLCYEVPAHDIIDWDGNIEGKHTIEHLAGFEDVLLVKISDVPIDMNSLEGTRIEIYDYETQALDESFDNISIENSTIFDGGWINDDYVALFIINDADKFNKSNPYSDQFEVGTYVGAWFDVESGKYTYYLRRIHKDAEIIKLDPKFLPDSVPYTKPSIEITWDGNIEGHHTIKEYDDGSFISYFVKVSDLTFEPEMLQGANLKINCGDYYDGDNSIDPDYLDKYPGGFGLDCLNGLDFIIVTNSDIFEEYGGGFENGIYFKRTPECYTESLTIPSQIVPLDTKYIPQVKPMFVYMKDGKATHSPIDMLEHIKNGGEVYFSFTDVDILEQYEQTEGIKLSYIYFFDKVDTKAEFNYITDDGMCGTFIINSECNVENCEYAFARSEDVEPKNKILNFIKYRGIYVNEDHYIEVADCDESISGSYIIPNTIDGSIVKSIGNSAFDGCRKLTNLIIPNSVTSIGEGVFHNCKNLTSITIPDSVTSIDYEAFYDCGIETITIPNNVSYIGRYAFGECVNLNKVIIQGNNLNIDEQAFRWCSALTEVVIGDGVSHIGSNVFQGCDKLHIIYYYGDETQWERIIESDSIPNGVRVVFNHRPLIHHELREYLFNRLSGDDESTTVSDPLECNSIYLSSETGDVTIRSHKNIVDVTDSRILNLGTPQQDKDATNKKYVDDAIENAKGVQGNWEQNDPNEPDYIHNRTHYVEDVAPIEWDGDITDRPYFKYGEYIGMNSDDFDLSMVKISDNTSVDKILSATNIKLYDNSADDDEEYVDINSIHTFPVLHSNGILCCTLLCTDRLEGVEFILVVHNASLFIDQLRLMAHSSGEFETNEEVEEFLNNLFSEDFCNGTYSLYLVEQGEDEFYETFISLIELCPKIKSIDTKFVPGCVNTTNNVYGWKIQTIVDNGSTLIVEPECVDMLLNFESGEYGNLVINIDCAKHWYNRYTVWGAEYVEDDVGNRYGVLHINPIFPELYPVNSTNISMGDSETDNWVWFLDENGKNIYDESAKQIDQYIASIALGHKTFAAGYGAFATGRETQAIGNYATAIGRKTSADYASFAMGINSKAIGQYSFAGGSGAKALGHTTFAFGADSTEARGKMSFAIGTGAIANGVYSTAFGNRTIANNDNQFVVGKFNVGLTDTIFEVGVGQTNTSRTNGFAVYLDGHAIVNSVDKNDNRSVVNVATLDAACSNLYSSISSIGTKLNKIPLQSGDNIGIAQTGSCSAVFRSAAFGTGTKVTGSYSLGAGNGLEVIHHNQMVCGKFNDSSKLSSEVFFAVGAGVKNEERYNAFSVGRVYNKKSFMNLGNVKLTEDKLSELVNIDTSKYVKNTDYATGDNAGVVKVKDGYGITSRDNTLMIISATNDEIKSKANGVKPITSNRIDYAVKVGLTTNAETLTDEEKAVARGWLGAVGSTDYATSDKAGVVKVSLARAFSVDKDGYLTIAPADNAQIDKKTSRYTPITPISLDYAVKVGVTTNTETLTEEEKASAQSWLGITELVGDIETLLGGI